MKQIKLNKKIKAYKIICEMANVPQLLIDHPELIISKKPTRKDIIWAMESIKTYEQERTETAN